VEEELRRAVDKEKKLFQEKGKRINTIIPIMIDDYVLNGWESEYKNNLQRYVIGDFKNWKDPAAFEKSLNDLIEALDADRGEEGPPSFL